MSEKGKQFRKLVFERKPLKVVGVINAYSAKLAQKAGVEAIYLSGAGVANACYGLPDLGMTSLNDVADEVVKICQATDLPLLVDGDTGWGGTLNIEYAVKKLINSGASGVHFEDQSWPKRCGHRDGKELVPADDMIEKLKAAVRVRDKLDPSFVIMARTDALSVEGIDSAISRSKEYVSAGADMIFAESVTTLNEYKAFVDALPDVPVLANITEFGKTPLFNEEELAGVGIKIMLFPLSAFRAMSMAAEKVFKEIVQHGTQASLLDDMQPRTELYDTLDYESFESKVR